MPIQVTDPDAYVAAARRAARRALLEAVRASGGAKVRAGRAASLPDAARCQDLLYDQDGIPA